MTNLPLAAAAKLLGIRPDTLYKRAIRAKDGTAQVAGYRVLFTQEDGHWYADVPDELLPVPVGGEAEGFAQISRKLEALAGHFVFMMSEQEKRLELIHEKHQQIVALLSSLPVLLSSRRRRWWLPWNRRRE